MATHLPHPAFSFSVEAGFTRVGFSRVVLPTLDRDVVRYRDGNDPSESARKLPGLLTVGDCVLERGVVPADTELFQWLSTAGGGTVQRRDVVVKLLDASHSPVLAWRLRNTFPVALEWSVLDAQHSTVLVERLRIAVEAVDLQAS
jgi:phage tail-like protein